MYSHCLEYCLYAYKIYGSLTVAVKTLNLWTNKQEVWWFIS